VLALKPLFFSKLGMTGGILFQSKNSSGSSIPKEGQYCLWHQMNVALINLFVAPLDLPKCRSPNFSIGKDLQISCQDIWYMSHLKTLYIFQSILSRPSQLLR
jgi:hypothetical protein